MNFKLLDYDNIDDNLFMELDGADERPDKNIMIQWIIIIDGHHINFPINHNYNLPIDLIKNEQNTDRG